MFKIFAKFFGVNPSQLSTTEEADKYTGGLPISNPRRPRNGVPDRLMSMGIPIKSSKTKLLSSIRRIFKMFKF